VVAQILPSASGASVLGKKVRSTTGVFCLTSWPCDELTDCRSTRHNAVKPYGQLVTRFFCVTSWPCDELTGSRGSWQSSYEPNSICSSFFDDVGLEELTGSITVVVLHDLASTFWFIQQFPPQHGHCTAGLYGRRTRSQHRWKMLPVLQLYCNPVTRPYNMAV